MLNYVKNFTLDILNKELISVGFNDAGANVIIDTLELCVRDLKTFSITCMKGCDQTRIANRKYYFTNYKILSFIGSFDKSYNSLAKFGLQYVVIN